MRTAPDSAAWGSLISGIGSVVTLPLAIYLTRFVAAYELRDVWVGIPVAAALGMVAVAMASRARRRNAVLLGRGGRLGLARAGRILGIVGLGMASATTVAFAVLGLLEYAGSRG